MTSLFIGAKIEEIYPPKLSEFAYVTDGACSEDEILSMELVILKELNWGLSPMTPNAWMKLYMQSSSAAEEVGEHESFVVPQYSGLPFSRAMQLLDLVVLDMGSLSHRYSVLAASAFCLTVGDRAAALKVSGYAWEDIAPCVNWMCSFAQALKEDTAASAAAGAQPAKSFANVSVENQHNIQSHAVELATLERAQEKLAAAAAAAERAAVAARSPGPTPTKYSGTSDAMSSSTSSTSSWSSSGEERYIVEMTPPVETTPSAATTRLPPLTPTSTTSALLLAAQQQQQPSVALCSGASVFLSPQTPSTNAAAAKKAPTFGTSILLDD